MNFGDEHVHVAAIVATLTKVRWYQGTGETVVPPAPSSDGADAVGFAGWDFGEEHSEPLSMAGDQLVEGEIQLEIFEQKNCRGRLLREAAVEAWQAFKAASDDQFAFLTIALGEKLQTEGFVGRRFVIGFKQVRE